MKENAVILLQKSVSWVPEAPQGLNMELDLQSLFGLLCTAVNSLAETPQPPTPPPRIWAHIRGRNWSAKIDDISL